MAEAWENFDSPTMLYEEFLKWFEAKKSIAPAATIAHPGNSFTCVAKTPHFDKWIIDSGASAHISGNKNTFTSFSYPNYLPSITSANGSQVQAKGIGTAKPFTSITVDSVLYIPECPFNLLSVYQLCRNLNCSVTFSDHSVIVQDRSTGKTIGVGHESEGLYYLTTPKASMVCPATEPPLIVHQRLGHPSLSKLQPPEVVEKPGDTSLSRLKTLYMQAKELAESEVSISSQLLVQLDAFMPPGPQGQQQRRRMEGTEQKKKRMKTDSDVTRLTPSMRNQLDAFASLKGEQVAARVTQENDEKDEWFVVKVLHFDRETREFEVLDEDPGDDEEGGGPRKYKLATSYIIPFPKRNDPSGAQDFPPGKQVLAVYPGTTALYKASVVLPRKRKIDDYVLEFDDDEEEDGSLPHRIVPFHRVVGLPEGHRQ